VVIINTNPLIGNPPSEISLKDPPLICVIAQVRFSQPIRSIEERTFIDPFYQTIQEDYPTLKIENSFYLEFKEQKVIRTESKVWRFEEELNKNWRVSLTSYFVALETIGYSGQEEFFERLLKILKAVDSQIKPQSIARFGLRYIDRLTGEDTKNITNLVRPEMAGILSTEFGEYIHQTINESLFKLPEKNAEILARWGLLPANTTIDPSIIEPIDEPSWILDLDISSSLERPFDVDSTMKEAKSFAERIYTFFRWVVTDNFLSRFGGEL